MSLKVYAPQDAISGTHTIDRANRSFPNTARVGAVDHASWSFREELPFSHLTASEIEALERVSRVVQFPKSAPVYLPSEAADCVYWIMRGMVKTCNINQDGRVSTLLLIGPREPFGEIAILDSGPRQEYVETIVPTTAVRIPANHLRDLSVQNPGFALGISELMARRRRRLEKRLGNLLFVSNHQRLVHLLLDLAEQFGAPNGSGVRLDLKLSHQDIANVIGTTRETVTILLGKLKAAGLVTGRRQYLESIDYHRLADLVKH